MKKAANDNRYPRICEMPACKSLHRAKGMCSAHYQRIRRIDKRTGWTNKAQLALPGVDVTRKLVRE